MFKVRKEKKFNTLDESLVDEMRRQIGVAVKNSATESYRFDILDFKNFTLKDPSLDAKIKYVDNNGVEIKDLTEVSLPF